MGNKQKYGTISAWNRMAESVQTKANMHRTEKPRIRSSPKMPSEILLDALRITNSYLTRNYTNSQLRAIHIELSALTGGAETPESTVAAYSYEETQLALACLNEKESIRKDKGVYYTPSDIVQFILTNSVKMACIKRRPDNLSDMELDGDSHSTFCYPKTVYDPTCGAGVLL